MERTANEYLITGYLLDAHASLTAAERDLIGQRLLAAFGRLPMTMADLGAAADRLLADLRTGVLTTDPMPGDVLELRANDWDQRYFIVDAVIGGAADDTADLRGLEIAISTSASPGSVLAYYHVARMPADLAVGLKHLTGDQAAQVREQLATMLEQDWQQHAETEQVRIREQNACLSLSAAGILPVNWDAPAPPAPSPRTQRFLSVLGALALAGVPDALETAARIDQALSPTADPAVPVSGDLTLQQVLYRDYGLAPGDLVESTLHRTRHVAVITGATAREGRLRARLRLYRQYRSDWLPYAYQELPPDALIRRLGGAEAQRERERILSAVLAQHEREQRLRRTKLSRVQRFLRDPSRPMPEMLTRRLDVVCPL